MCRVKAFVWSLLLTLVPGSAPLVGQSEIWRYVEADPGDGWTAADFDDATWKQGEAGFGTDMTPGTRVGTVWDSGDIWLRRSFVQDALPARPALLVHHDEQAEIYLNGSLIATLSGFSTEYEVVTLTDEARRSLKQGPNLLAVHCHQTVGGQYIDVLVIDADDVPDLSVPSRLTRPFQTELLTRWGEEVTAENAWTEYPRPQLVRDHWANLNGYWEYAVTSNDATAPPAEFDGDVLVPFCLESRLSGVGRLLAPTETLWYRRTFDSVPNEGERTLLHFEAVDHRCRVWVNGQEVGSHVGGNTPFSFDISDALREGQDEIVVRVDDATEGMQLRGKQVLRPNGIWYTRVSGIWQTVWLEHVPTAHVTDVDYAWDGDKSRLTVSCETSDPTRLVRAIRVRVRDGDGRVVSDASERGTEITLAMESPRLWSPDSPHLYDVEVMLLGDRNLRLDSVRSYTGLRTVGAARDDQGHLRFTLNGDELFHWGTLDQGWWPDGLLTPPSDEAMAWDVEFLKSAGFNMIRKHIKVEPRRYYYHCDRLGMLLWQDQVSGGNGPPWTHLAPDPVDADWADEDHAQYMAELEAMVEELEDQPSIVVWVPFNEAWGQHRTVEVGRWLEARDPTRLVNVASGGNFWPVGDIVDQHSYPHPGFPFDADRYEDFVKVVGEFGGHGWPVQEHLWDDSPRNWGYGGLPKTIEEYEERYRESIRLLAELRAQGIAGGVYTQTTDVEGEINGLVTYDRKVVKIPPEQLRRIHAALGVVPPDRSEDR